LLDVLLPADGSSFAADALLATPGHGQIIEMRTQAGAIVTVMIGATHINRTAAGGSLHAYLLRDVTEEEAHNRLRSYFLASISHEFRTPLSTLKASLELLVTDDAPLSPSEVGQLLRPAYLSVVGLQTLVDNLLTSSTIEAGRFVLHLADVDVGLILADAVRVVQPMLERRQQQLIVDLPASRSAVRGDAAQLTQVLINFLTNAAKYSPNNATLEVIISQPGANVLRVAVLDEGPGIAADARTEIFRRFVRHHDNEREQYGVGLGLYVAKSAILAHGGRIDVADRPGGGSEFWFELPVQEAPARKALEGEAA
jgi:signal transduction histidine kinase